MTEGPRKPEQASLESELDSFDSEGRAVPQNEPSGIDSIPLIQESHEFPEAQDQDQEPIQAASSDEVRGQVEPAGEAVAAAEPPAPESSVQGTLIAEPPGQESLLAAADQQLPDPEEVEDGGGETVEQLAFDDPGFDEVERAGVGDPGRTGEDWDDGAIGMDPAESGPTAAESPLPTRFPQQWIVAGLADLAVNLAVVALGAVAVRQLGIPVQWSGWPGYLGFALSFSFLYTSMPLAFWGQTPGMALFGLRAADGDRQLSFGQTALRWAAAGVTLATLGLPWLLARSGRPLADRLSRSETLVWHEPED